MQLALNIKRAKRVHNLTNTKLASDIGTSRRTVERLLAKADDPSFPYTPLGDTVTKIATYLHVEPETAQKRLPAETIESIYF